MSTTLEYAMDLMDFVEMRRNAPMSHIYDLRSAADFEKSHLAGAKSLPLSDLETRLRELPPFNEISLYGYGHDEVISALDLLKKFGFDNLNLVYEGYEAIREMIDNDPDELKLDSISDEEKPKFIEQTLNQKVRPMLEMDGGGLTLLKVEQDKVYVRYEGACGSCSSSTAGTLNFIANALSVALNHDMTVIPE